MVCSNCSGWKTRTTTGSTVPVTRRIIGYFLSSSWYFVVFWATTVGSYYYSPCNRRHRREFQLPDCYVPPLSTSLDLSQASFLMSHNAATGYIQATSSSVGGLAAPYAKTQVGSFYQQLNDGARALDLRLKLLKNQTIVFHHGSVQISTSLEQGLQDVLQWANQNPQELVLLLPSHFDYENSNTGGNGLAVYAANLYQKYGISYFSCKDVYGWNVQDAMDASAVGNGHVLVMDSQDYYGTPCAKSNWIEQRLVTCWTSHDSGGKRKNCKTDDSYFTDLLQYAMESSNNEATDDFSTLGPPASLDQTPFNEIQALWQSTTNSIVTGLAHFSTLLQDNTQSRVNEKMATAVYEGKFKAISLFGVDNVAEHGRQLLSVLRTQCGQSETESTCGTNLVPPRSSSSVRISVHDVFWTLFALYLFWFIYFVCRVRKGGKIWRTFRSRVTLYCCDQQDTIVVDDSDLLDK